MPFKKQFSNLLQILVLGGTTWVVAATSYSDLEGASEVYYISSDCISPAAKDVQVTVDAGVVTEPAGTAMGDFGFPQDDLLEPGSTTNIFPEEVEGVIGSVTRRCRKTYSTWDIDNETRVYSCSDEDQYSCTLILKDASY